MEHTSNCMDVKSEKILTVIVVAIVAVLMISFVIAVIMNKNDSIDDDALSMFGIFFSMTITVVVIMFGAIVLNNRSSTSEMYKKYVEEREKEKRQ